MQALRRWLLRRAKTPFPTALGYMAAVLVVGLALGVLVSLSSEVTSLSISATTESVTMENICERGSLDLVLPPGQLRQLSSTDDALKPIDLTSPTLVRLTGKFKLSVRRRAYEPLRLTVGPSSEAADIDGSWSARIFGPDTVAGGKELQPLQMSYESDSSGETADAVALPLAGRVILGESASTSYGEVSETVPHPAHLLLEGTIRVRAGVWGGTRRIDLAEHSLELGDVADTAQRASVKNTESSGYACSRRQAQGMVRLDKDGALHSIVHVDQDNVSVLRGRVVKVGSSAIENFTQQPLVKLAWQGALIIFLLIGVLQQLFEIVSFYSKPETNMSSSKHDDERTPPSSHNG